MPLKWCNQGTWCLNGTTVVSVCDIFCLYMYMYFSAMLQNQIHSFSLL